MAVVLFAALALFLVRGPWRAMSGGGDFAAPYVAGLRFVRGVNPYSHTGFMTCWHDAGAPRDRDLFLSDEMPVYPPTTLFWMSPFTLLRWQFALGAFEALCSLLLAWVLVRFARRIGDGWRSWRRVGFLAYSLALSPLHAGMAQGNLSLAALLLCLWAFLSVEEDRDAAAGLALALSISLKPGAGFPMLVYLALSRRWRPVWIAAVASTMVAAVSWLLMLRIPRAWILDYKANAAYLFGPDGAANYGPGNGGRFDLLNLQVAFSSFTQSATLADALAWGVFAALSAFWLWRFLRDERPRTEWAAPASLLLLGLLPVYQRNYNAGLALLALAWAFKNLHSRLAWGVVAAGAVLLVPGEALLRRFWYNIPGILRDSFAMKFLLLPQATWAVVAIACLLIAAMRSRSEPSRIG